MMNEEYTTDRKHGHVLDCKLTIIKGRLLDCSGDKAEGPHRNLHAQGVVAITVALHCIRG